MEARLYHIIAVMMLFPGSCWLVTQTLTEEAAVPVRPSLICHNEVILLHGKVQIYTNYKINTIRAQIGSSTFPIGCNEVYCRRASIKAQTSEWEIKGKIHPFIHVLAPIMFSMSSRLEAGYTQSMNEEITLYLLAESCSENDFWGS